MSTRTAAERAAAAIAALEADLGRVSARPARQPRRHAILPTVLGAIVTTAVLVVLPFAVLVRSFTLGYGGFGLPTWVALTCSIGATVLVVTAYAAVLSRKFTGKARVRTVFRRVALPLVLAYCAYALLYLSSANAKGPEVRAYYRSLHPALRIALSTVILVDRDIVVTDAHRTPADYAAMGLPVNRGSLHYRQSDGHVHAIDLRTKGRAAWENWAVKVYFAVMGFDTLRHVGTEDHLHVELPLR